MNPGPHPFGHSRQSLWVASNENLTDKLIHYLPRLRAAIPNLTDVLLPPEATTTHRGLVLQADFFHAMYDVARGRSPQAFVSDALNRFKNQKAGWLELNFEGSAITDLPTANTLGLNEYIRRAIGFVRAAKPRLPVRVNVVPYKGRFLPVDLFVKDDQLALAVQAYGGNMDVLYAPDEVVDEVVAFGIPREKVVPMYAVQCAQKVGAPRHTTLPQVRNRGAFYIDDLLLDAGLLP
jgi:hypothetical protein